MAELQLAQEATPPASEVGSNFPFPSNVFRSADLPLVTEEASAVLAEAWALCIPTPTAVTEESVMPVIPRLGKASGATRPFDEVGEVL